MSSAGAISSLFHICDVHRTGQLSAEQLFQMYDHIRVGGISLNQVAASMERVCGGTDSILLSEMEEVLQEMDRRFFLVQDLQWEFALLDNEHRGSISVGKARFLFEAVHGKMFSLSKWNRFLSSRVLPDAPVSFAEVEVELCDLPSPDDWELDVGGAKRIEELKIEEERKQKKQTEEKQKKKREKVKEEKKKAEFAMPVQIANPLKEKQISASPVGSTDDAITMNEQASVLAEKKEMERLRAQERKEKQEKKRREREEKREEKREKKRQRGAEHEKLLKDLETAFDSRDANQLEPAIANYKEGIPRKRDQDELLAEAERLLEMLKCSATLKDAMTQRVIADLEYAINRAKKSGFDKAASELAEEVEAASELLMRLKRLEKLRSEVLELKQSTIAELRSYQKPIPVIHNVMVATYLLLGTSEKETKDWQNVQALLGKTGREGLKRRIGQCNVLKIQASTAKRARDVMGVVDLELIRDVSAGAATFFVWAEGMIEEVENDSKT